TVQECAQGFFRPRDPTVFVIACDHSLRLAKVIETRHDSSSLAALVAANTTIAIDVIGTWKPRESSVP
ncbi:MAG TPA: hypothetical protein VNQ15_07075, partial [Verrucomicrobiae bacterium]|nr:hypothetical protein [Verrucomicrobiae bacterium]